MGSTTYSKEDLIRLLVDLITHRAPIKDIQVVIRAGVETNGVHRKGLRPLHYAAFEDYVDALTFLIDETGAEINVEDDLGYTPLHIACKHGNYNVTIELLKRRALINFLDEAQTSLKTARALASLTINPLSLALESNHSQCVDALLKFGANPNQCYFLGYEINLIPMENTRSLELLLQYGAEPNVFGRAGLSPLMKACKDKQLGAVNVLLRHGADVNLQCPPKFDQKTALHFAATGGNPKVIKRLLVAGASTNRPVNYDHSALDFAIFADQAEAVEALLAYGADPDELNSERCTALQIAVSTSDMKNQKLIIEHLLRHGADPNYHSQTFSYMGPSLTPLVEYFGYMEAYDIGLMRMMLAYGARVNMTRPTRHLRIKDPCGILGQIRKLRPYEDIFFLLLEASGEFDVDSVYKESSLSNKQKQLILNAGSVPRDLSHLTRLCIRQLVKRPLPPNIKTLPLPAYLQSHLLYHAEL